MDINFRSVNMGNSQCLIFELDDNFVINEFDYKMLHQNNSSSIIKAELCHRNSDAYLQYNVTGLQSLEHIFRTAISKSTFINIMENIIHVFEEIDEYMLDSNSVVLDSKYVFVDANNQCYMIYLPIKGNANNKNDLMFLKELVERKLHHSDGSETYIYDLSNAFNRDAINSLARLKEHLHKYKSDSTVKPTMERVVEEPQKQEESGKNNGWGINIPNIGLNSRSSNDKGSDVKEEVVPKPASNLPFDIPGVSGSANNSPVSFDIPDYNLPFSIPGVSSNPVKSSPAESKKNKKEKAEKNKNKEKPEKSGMKFSLFGGKEKKKKENSIDVPKDIDVNEIQPQSDVYLNYSQTVVMDDPDFGFALRNNNHSIDRNIPPVIPEPVVKEKVKNEDWMGVPYQEEISPTPDILKAPVEIEENNYIAKPYEQNRPTVPDSVPVAVQSEPEESTVLIDSEFEEATVVLDDYNMLQAELVRKNTGERFPIVGMASVWGSGKSADCRIDGNKHISRRHIMLEIINDNFYVTDLDSSNYTYLNNEKLIPNKKCLLNNGDCLKLANEEFSFVIK